MWSLGEVPFYVIRKPITYFASSLKQLEADYKHVDIGPTSLLRCVPLKYQEIPAYYAVLVLINLPPQLQSKDDLTGTRVTTSSPASVFSGAVSTSVGAQFMADHLVEQLPPIQMWETGFITTPLATRTAGDIFRIVSEYQSVNQSNFYSFNIPGKARISGTTAESEYAVGSHWQ